MAQISLMPRASQSALPLSAQDSATAITLADRREETTTEYQAEQARANAIATLDALDIWG